MDNVRILVISDLHVGASFDAECDTKLIYDGQPNIYGLSIIEYIKSLTIKIDLLVCSGDIGNRGCSKSFTAGWNYVNQLVRELRIPSLLCVPGNHDHQSMPLNSSNPEGFSPKHELQFVNPPFPFNCHQKNTHFWAWNWELTSNESYNAISINSSAYHGFGSEFKHGRIALEVCDQIRNRLTASDIVKKPFNLLICHHHPQKMDYVDKRNDIEAMEGAEYLLQALESADIGPWLIIHGHKHYATISYGISRTSTPPTIFAAGSLSAVLYDSIKDRTSNQFYIVDVDLIETGKNGKVVGCFETYESNPLNQWQPSTSSNLPAKGGFGSLYTPEQIKYYLEQLICPDNQFLEGTELNEFRRRIMHLPPFEFSRLEKILERDGYMLEMTKSKEVIEIGKRYE